MQNNLCKVFMKLVVRHTPTIQIRRVQIGIIVHEFQIMKEVQSKSLNMVLP